MSTSDPEMPPDEPGARRTFGPPDTGEAEPEPEPEPRKAGGETEKKSGGR